MSIRTLLAIAEDGPDAEARLTAATALAGLLEAHLDVLALVVQPSLDYGAGAGYAATAMLDEIYRAGERADLLAKSIRDRLARAGTPAEVRGAARSPGGIAAEVARQGRTADLILSGRSSDEELGPLLSRATDGALFDSGRPVAYLPPGWDRPFGSRIMIAWDGSREAARAVAGAGPLIERAEEIRIAIADPDAGTDAMGDEPGTDLGEALSRHNRNVTVDRLAGMGHSVAQTLTTHALDIGTDLIVLGAYGHARLTEAMFGGVTRDMLRGAPLPLLLAH